MQESTVVAVGSKLTHDAFLKRHVKFFTQIDNLTAAEDVVFGRTLNAAGLLDPVVFYLGIRSVQDFNAILLLVAHGHALPANAMVRGMYERVVTAAYLRENPDEVAAFANFDYVQRFKAATAIKQTIGLEPDEEAGFEELKKNYESVKPDFMVTDCKKCGTKTLGPSWSKVNFVDMAKKVPPLSDLIVGAYYLPLLQAHSTLKSITSMLHQTDGELAFKTDYTEQCDEIVRLAYLLLMHVFTIQAEHFKTAELEKAVESVIGDYLDVYPNKASALAAGV